MTVADAGTRFSVELLHGDEDVEQWLSFRKAAAR
jgi:hypothetical protein